MISVKNGRCEVDSTPCVPGEPQTGSVGRVVRVILCAACGAQWVGRSGWPTRALSPAGLKEGRSVGRSDPKFASPRCARRVGRSVCMCTVTQYYGRLAIGSDMILAPFHNAPNLARQQCAPILKRFTTVVPTRFRSSEIARDISRDILRWCCMDVSVKGLIII